MTPEINRHRLTVAEALALPAGTYVHVLHDNQGHDQHDDEVFHPAGSIAVVVGYRRDGDKARRDLMYPATGVSGTWEASDPDPFNWSPVTSVPLVLEARDAWDAFHHDDEPTPNHPTPLLDALIGPYRVIGEEPAASLFYEWQNDISDHPGGWCLVRIADDVRDEAWLLDATFPDTHTGAVTRALILAALDRPDVAATVRATVDAYCAALNDDDQEGGAITPNGDDFNDLIDAIEGALASGVVPTIKLSHKGR